MVLKSLRFFSIALCVLVAGSLLAGEKAVNSVHDFTLDGIDGKPYALSQHKNQVMLIVNVASQCGYTSQYKGLQELHTKYAGKGFTVIGVPANEAKESARSIPIS
jgi:glutathione peroxidase